MQKELGLTFDGRLHSGSVKQTNNILSNKIFSLPGIDDCKNIVKIMSALAKDGCVFENNGASKR